MLYTCLNSSSHLAHRPATGTYHRLSLLRRKIELQLRVHAPLNCVASPATFADNRTHQLQHGHPRVPNLLACTASKGRTPQPVEIDNYELLVGDCVALVCFALYKQIAAIVLSPTFPGWLAPLSFNPLRFAEFANFAGMLLASWVVSAAITGGYRSATTASVPASLSAVCRAWLVSMPVAATQLVLVTAVESQALVTEDAFASALPLAASGPGEPLASAAGLLGVMAMWRAFYTVYLDSWNQRDFLVEAQRFKESMTLVALVAAACGLLLQVLQLTQQLGDGSQMYWAV